MQLPPSKCSTRRVLNLVCTCVFLEAVYQDKRCTRHNEMICPCESWNDWKRHYSTRRQILYLAFTIANTMSLHQVACINNTLYIIAIHGLARQESPCSSVDKAPNRYPGGHMFESCGKSDFLLSHARKNEHFILRHSVHNVSTNRQMPHFVQW